MDWHSAVGARAQATKQEHWEWCRAYIDHHCFFRSPPDTKLVLSPAGEPHTWSMCTQIATLNPEFCRRIGALFWGRFLANFERRPFQLCGCESGGVPLACALQSAGFSLGIKVNAFSIKKENKQYGLFNWLEGIVDEKLPVMMLDDVVKSQATISRQANRLRELLDLELYPQAFAIAAVRPRGSLQIKVGEQKINNNVLYFIEDFTMTYRKYLDRYGQPPVYGGSMR